MQKQRHMETRWTLCGLLVAVLLVIGQIPARATVVVTEAQENQANGLLDEATVRKVERRAEKLGERLERKLERKMERKSAKLSERLQGYDLMDDDRFRYGALMVLGGIVVSLVFASWLAWIGGLAVIAGLVLMCIAILEY